MDVTRQSGCNASMQIVFCIMWTETMRIIMRFVRLRIDVIKIWTSVDRPLVMGLLTLSSMYYTHDLGLTQ